MTSKDWTVEAITERAKLEIIADFEDGEIPEMLDDPDGHAVDVISSFGDLHEYVDANEYGGLTDVACPWDATNEAGAAIIDEVWRRLDVWIRERAIEQILLKIQSVATTSERVHGQPIPKDDLLLRAEYLQKLSARLAELAAR